MTEQDAFLRSICEHPDDDAPRLIFADWLEERGQRDRAEFIRIQCELAKMKCDRKGHHYPCRSRGPGGASGPFHTCHTLQKRERKLLMAYWAKWYPPIRVGVACRNLNRCRLPGFTIEFRRGFIESITCPCQQWLDHGPAILAACPTIREVRMSDKQPHQVAEHWLWGDEMIGAGYADRSCFLPPGIYARLVGRFFYESERQAVDALSQAALAYARNQMP